MFSTGQWVFALLFVLVFIIVLAKAYGADRALHKKNYKGVKWVGIVFLIFIVFLFAVKYFLKY